ncbi:hypothetical protein LNKW23_42570 [Paralimibaculum aggregatum]|uniref:Uncharacterized protein n=1 Tax=Paralimibaculum aggregatum TaxID=3036245 RepID=A0ABQ6LSJ9_9RHOB|nr:hypothetical protein LNKW23_42570 [Limibaculum sp. NKW23]
MARREAHPLARQARARRAEQRRRLAVAAERGADLGENPVGPALRGLERRPVEQRILREAPDAVLQRIRRAGAPRPAPAPAPGRRGGRMHGPGRLYRYHGVSFRPASADKHCRGAGRSTVERLPPIRSTELDTAHALQAP